MLTVLAVAVQSGVAYAYIDLGTGSFLLQMLLATIFASLFTIKVFWKKFGASINSKNQQTIIELFAVLSNCGKMERQNPAAIVKSTISRDLCSYIARRANTSNAKFAQ